MWELWHYVHRVLNSILGQVAKVKRSLYSAFYDLHIDNTHEMYRIALDEIEVGAKILEVGIGNGTCIDKNADMIKKKKLRIHGIDIDEEYLEVCNLKITENDLHDHVTAKVQDLLALDPSVYGKFDYVFFMESFPVIPEDIMCQMIQVCKSLLNKGGKLVFVHNLVVKKNPVHAYLKPKLINIPFIWVDFGRLTTHDEWQGFVTKNGLNQEKKQCIMNVELADKYLLVPKKLSFNMEQFLIICSFLDKKTSGTAKTEDTAAVGKTADTSMVY